jgi:small subunit ribosomal protein S6e
MRIIISDPKSGKSFQSEVPKEQEGNLLGKKIGDELDGGFFGAAGYSLLVTGGSDKSGFPLRNDIPGDRKMKALITEGVGFHNKRKGMRKRKVVRGNTLSQDTVQINTKVVKAGANPLEDIFKSEEKKE